MELGADIEDPEAPAGPPPVARVVVADGDPLARRVIESELAAWPEFEIVASTGRGAEVVDTVAELQPDLVLLELAMPGLDGAVAIRRICQATPGTRVVVFTVLPGDSDGAVAALSAGASGYVAKEQGVEATVDALRRVHRGEAAIPPKLTLRVIELLREAPDGGMGLRPVHSTLTTREWEVLDLMAQGATTRGVAGRLFVSEDTVYSHVKNIMRKLDVHTRADAVRAARRLMQPTAYDPPGLDGAPPRVR